MNAQEPQTLGDFNGFEVYAMPVFIRIEVADLAASAAWYERNHFSSTCGAANIKTFFWSRLEDRAAVASPMA